MKPPETQAKRPPSYAQDEVNGWTVDFTAQDASGHSAAAQLRRVYQLPGRGLIRMPLEKDGLEGFLYYPVDGGRFPGVIILGG
jgi:hypothetical protein